MSPCLLKHRSKSPGWRRDVARKFWACVIPEAWFFMWILCLAEDSLETSSLIFSEKQWKYIYECRLLQSWLALGGLTFKMSKIFTWNIKSYFLWKTMKIYLWMSSAAVVIGPWRVNIQNVKNSWIFKQLRSRCGGSRFLHCVTTCLWTVNMIQLRWLLLKICNVNFVICLFAAKKVKLNIVSESLLQTPPSEICCIVVLRPR